MALAFSRSVSVDSSSGWTVLGADADANGIYVLYRVGSTDSIVTLDRQGAVQGDVTPVPFNGTNRGVARVGDGFAYAFVTGSRIDVNILTAAGSVDNTIGVTLSGYQPRGLVYRAATADYLIFARELFPVSPRNRVYQLAGDGSSASLLAEFSAGGDDFQAVTASADKYYVVRDEDTTAIPEYDAALNALGTTQARDSTDTGVIGGLAFSLGQLVVVTKPSDVKLSFYGDEPMVPGTDSEARGHRQLPLNSPAFEYFDVVRGDTDITSVVSVNFRAVRQTSLAFVDVPGTETLQERIAKVEIIPEYTLPDIQQDDKIFLHSGDADAEPDSLPDAGVYNVEGIISVGANFRQRFVCSEVTS